MTSGLFRREVLEARKEDWLGSVHLPPTRLGWPMAILAALVVLVVAAMLMLGGYTRKEHARGQLVPVGGLLNISATVSGVVTRQFVSEGMAVRAGQPLIEITPDIDLPQTGGAVGERIASELDHHQERLQMEIAQLKAAVPPQEAVLRHRIESLRQQWASAASELVLREHQVDAAEKMLARIRPLQEARTISAVQVRQFEDQLWDVRAQRELALRNRLNAQQSLSEVLSQLDQLPAQTSRRLNEIEGALADIAQAKARNLALRPTVLRAPRAGIVSGLVVDPGQAIHERQRLLSIVPGRAQFEAELWVSSGAVGSLVQGDRVAMRYDAFPYQEFGRQSGRIVAIAGSPLTPEEVRTRTGIDPGVPTFRVVVALERQEVQSGARSLKLRTGMSVDADLLLGRRRLYELMLAPSNDAKPRPRSHPGATSAGDSL